MYLMNHILQTSRKKPEAIQDYLSFIEPAVEHVLRVCDDSAKSSVNRLIAVWDERAVFDAGLIMRLKSISTLGHTTFSLTF